MAQSDHPGLAGARFPWQAQYFEDLDKSFCDVHVRCAGSHRVRVRSLGRVISPLNPAQTEQSRLLLCRLSCGKKCLKSGISASPLGDLHV